MLDGFLNGLGSLSLLSNAKTRSISAENMCGEKGRGASSAHGAGEKCAEGLGVGWKVSPNVWIKPGDIFVLADIDGPGVIQSMWFGGDVGSNFILRIYWDGQDTPSVESPITNFFGDGWQKEFGNVFGGPFFPLNSLPVCVNPNKGMNCFWPMPFRRHCKMTVENRSRRDYNCYYQINYALTDVPDSAAYFHARFRRTNPVPYKDVHVILDGVKGRGQYVGTTLFIGLNGAGNWWGEGEVKFYMDGDTDFPTICGTGTEDYVGGSFDWEVDGKYQPYSTPFMGMHKVIQSDGLYNHQQRFSMYRWHIMDPVRFESDIKVTIQDLGWAVLGEKYLPRQDDISSVAYWYQTLPTVPFPPLQDKDYLAII